MALPGRKIGLTELIDGILVEKPLGHFESRLAVVLISLIEQFVFLRKLGAVYEEACPIRLFPEQIREPDVSFFRWSRFPEGKLPAGQVLGFAPDLAVEVISPSNITSEMECKLAEYFQAGVQLVWYIYLNIQCIRVFRSVTDYQDLSHEEVLDGGEVLPGFAISVKEIFDRALGV